MADSYLTQAELRAMAQLKQDAVRLTRRNDTIIDVIARLEEALKENEALKQRIVHLERELMSLD